MLNKSIVFVLKKNKKKINNTQFVSIQMRRCCILQESIFQDTTIADSQLEYSICILQESIFQDTTLLQNSVVYSNNLICITQVQNALELSSSLSILSWYQAGYDFRMYHLGTNCRSSAWPTIKPWDVSIWIKHSLYFTSLYLLTKLQLRSFSFATRGWITLTL